MDSEADDRALLGSDSGCDARDGWLTELDWITGPAPKRIPTSELYSRPIVNIRFRAVWNELAKGSGAEGRAGYEGVARMEEGRADGGAGAG